MTRSGINELSNSLVEMNDLWRRVNSDDWVSEALALADLVVKKKSGAPTGFVVLR